MKKLITTSLTLLTVLNSCINVDDAMDNQPDTDNLVTEGPMTGLNVPNNFSFNTSNSTTVSLKVPEFLKGAAFSLHLTSNENDSLPFATANFNDNGDFNEYFELPSLQDSITIRSQYAGLVDLITVPVENGNAYFDYRPTYERSQGTTGKSTGTTKKGSDSFELNGFTFLSTFDSNGVPNNLVTPDTIQQSLLDDINASVPNFQKLPITRPDYLAAKETNIILTKEADVWITFVSEGAGWKNALGYYTYPIGEEPSSIEEIDTHYIIFPNVSKVNSGGGLLPGDKVHLGRFPENTVVSWFLVANGFNGSSVSNNTTHYSQPELNSETSTDLQKHLVVLYDIARELSILTFEDVPRNWPGCDQDFNDAIFYATTNPGDAISTANFAAIDAANDNDNDGVNDELDQFPNDPELAFSNFVPSEDSNATLAYEDLWPSVGDYDFNDLVVAYNYNILTNGSGKVKKIKATYTVEHIGGVFHNGFAITFPIASSNIESVTNQVLTSNYFSIDANGTETDTASDETVIVIADDTYTLLDQELNIEITFSNPVSKESLGRTPFNPFIIIDGTREKEVHLPDFKPTSKAAFLGDKDDDSDATENRYYKTDKNLPWALHIYDDFTPPAERTPINTTYPKFSSWANSGGTTDLNWYIK